MLIVRTSPGDTCTASAPPERRFYIHERSFGYLIQAQPMVFEDLALALGLSAASRAADQALEDYALFRADAVDPALHPGVAALHAQAAEALELTFRALVHLVPPRFGATDFLLAETEQVRAWCYEDGYFTYATGDQAAAVMYAETGSLRELRSRIRRTPDADPSLRIVSGDGLFLMDQSFLAGPGTAKHYRTQAARQLRSSRPHTQAEAEAVIATITRRVSDLFPASVVTLDGVSVVEVCVARARLTLGVLLRSQDTATPSTSTTAAPTGEPALTP